MHFFEQKNYNSKLSQLGKPKSRKLNVTGKFSLGFRKLATNWGTQN